MSEDKDESIAISVGGKEIEMPIQKISKQRRTSKDLQSIAEDLGVCPFTILLQAAAGDFEALGYSAPEVERRGPKGDIYMEEILPMSVRVNAAKEAAQYIHAKKRAIEVTGNDDADPINVKFEGSIFDLLKVARGEG